MSLSSSISGHSGVLVTFIGKTVPTPNTHTGLFLHLSQKSVEHKCQGSFLDRVPFYQLVSLSLHQDLGDGGFAAHYAIRKCESSNTVLVFQEYS